MRQNIVQLLSHVNTDIVSVHERQTQIKQLSCLTIGSSLERTYLPWHHDGYIFHTLKYTRNMALLQEKTIKRNL